MNQQKPILSPPIPLWEIRIVGPQKILNGKQRPYTFKQPFGAGDRLSKLGPANDMWTLLDKLH